VVDRLEEGEKPIDFITASQAEALGDDEHCDVIVFPLGAIGRGVNIVFTRGPRVRQAAIGTIYFLTRPHPSTDDMQLLNSLAGRATQRFNARVFEASYSLDQLAKEWVTARNDIYRLAHRLLQEPLMASKLGSELFRPFVANQMVSIIQTIGRGMRDGCPVSVYFVDAAWAPQSALEQPDSARNSMLVQMVAILKDCIEHNDPVKRAIYAELYTPFYEGLRRTRNILFPESLAVPDDGLYAPDVFDDAYAHLEM
jgi:hypothetical protein